MKKTGSILKAARESKGLSLHEIGLSLKINSKILKAIEEGDSQQLPAKTFLRGFVQSYAAYLHLDVQNVLNSFYEEMGSTIPKPYHQAPTQSTTTASFKEISQPEANPRNHVAPTETTETHVTPVAEPIKPNKNSSEQNPVRDLDSSKFLNDQRKSNSKMKAIGVTLLVVLTAGIIFAKKMVDKYSKEAEVPSEQIAQTIEGATPLENESPVISDSDATEPTEESKSEGTANNASDSSTNRSEQLTPSSVSTTSGTQSTTPPPPALAAANKATATTTTSAAATVAPVTPPPVPAAPVVAEKPAIPEKPAETEEKTVKNLVLIIEALDTVDIEYSSPQGTPAKIKLGPEQVHTFKSKSGLRLKISNGGAVNLIVNGRDLGVPGDLGKPLTLSY